MLITLSIKYFKGFINSEDISLTVLLEIERKAIRSANETLASFRRRGMDKRKSQVFSVNIPESQQNWRSANSYMAERKRETSAGVCENLEGQGKCALGLKKR